MGTWRRVEMDRGDVRVPRGGVVGGEVRKASIDCIEVGDSTTLYPFADMRVGRSIFALWDAARADGGIYPGYNDPAFTTWTDASANVNDL